MDNLLWTVMFLVGLDICTPPPNMGIDGLLVGSLAKLKVSTAKSFPFVWSSGVAMTLLSANMLHIEVGVIMALAVISLLVGYYLNKHAEKHLGLGRYGILLMAFAFIFVVMDVGMYNEKIVYMSSMELATLKLMKVVK